MPVDLEVRPETEAWIRTVVRDEIRNHRRQGRQHGVDPSQMEEVMARMDRLRARMNLSREALEEAIEEHRRELGRGPLVDEPHSDA
jgi:hypothetical protein